MEEVSPYSKRLSTKKGFPQHPGEALVSWETDKTF